MKAALLSAAAYNLAWGALTILAPNLFFDLAGAERPNYPGVWQCVGMIVGVFGVGYAIAAFDPLRHWPIVLVGLLGKILGPIGFVMTAAKGELPWAFGVTILTNDLIWWAPFGVILWRAFDAAQAPAADAPAPSPEDAMRMFRDQRGSTLDSLSREGSGALLVFLRHAGCTFCREAMADLRERREAIESRGVRLVVAHMGDDVSAGAFLSRYGLGDISRIADPERALYRAFDLKRGSFTQLFGVRVALRGVAATLRGHLIGRLAGDGFQMPGAFLVRDGRIVAAHRHRTVADRPDYGALACSAPA